MERSSTSRDEGQTMAEYAIVLGVITVGVVAVFATLGTEIVALIDALADILPD